LAAAAEFCALAENQPKKIRLSRISSAASAVEKLFGFSFHLSTHSTINCTKYICTGKNKAKTAVSVAVAAKPEVEIWRRPKNQLFDPGFILTPSDSF